MKLNLIIISLAFLVACGNSKESKESDTVEENVEITKHGEDIQEEGAVSAASFLTQFENKDSLNIKLTAEITEVCSSKGCWMKLDMGNNKTMRVTFKDYGFFVPKDAAGKTAILQGVAKIDTVDVATLRHYAEDADATQEEIDAITEPEINYAFEAVGVIIKDEITFEVK